MVRLSYLPILLVALALFLEGCSIGGSMRARNLKPTDIFVQRKNSSFTDRFELPDTSDSEENYWYYNSKETYYPGTLSIGIVTSVDTIPAQQWVYLDYRNQMAFRVSTDSIKFYHNLVRKRGGEMVESQSRFQLLSDSILEVRTYNKYLIEERRLIPLSQLRYLIIDRQTQHRLGLRSNPGEKIGVSLLTAGGAWLYIAPWLSFGKWTGISGSYLNRFAIISLPGVGALSVGGIILAVSRKRDDVYFRVLNQPVLDKK
jgi:hypothetical protein